MVGFFKGAKEVRLRKKYQKLLKEAYSLTGLNRELSDAKYAEAERIINELDRIREESFV